MTNEVVAIGLVDVNDVTALVERTVGARGILVLADVRASAERAVHERKVAGVVRRVVARIGGNQIVGRQGVAAGGIVPVVARHTVVLVIGRLVPLLLRGNHPSGAGVTCLGIPVRPRFSPRYCISSILGRVGVLRSGWLPVLGRSAAGIVFFWKDLPNGSGQTPAEKLSQLIDAYLNAEAAAAWIASIDQTIGQPSDFSDTASLIQVNVPSDAAVSEFLDCPAVRKRYPDAFALRIDGDSMLPQFAHGDLLIVSPSAPAADGKPAVVQLHGQLGVTCKLYRRQGDRVHLIPTNEKFSAQTFPASDILWALRVLFRVRINSHA